MAPRVGDFSAGAAALIEAVQKARRRAPCMLLIPLTKNQQNQGVEKEWIMYAITHRIR